MEPMSFGGGTPEAQMAETKFEAEGLERGRGPWGGTTSPLPTS